MSMDSVSAFLIIDYSDQLLYYKLGSKCPEIIKDFVLKNSQNCFGTSKFKLHQVEEKQSKVNKICSINELKPSTADFNYGIFVVERQ